MTSLLHDYLKSRTLEVNIKEGTLWIYNSNFYGNLSKHFFEDVFQLTSVTDNLIEYVYLEDGYESEIFRYAFESEVRDRIIIPFQLT